MKVYTVMKNRDTTEGRGPMVAIETFTTEADAWMFCHGKPGVMGRKPDDGDWKSSHMGDWTVRETEVHDSLKAFKVSEDVKLRISGRAKLTPEERTALGV